jgi:oxygen-dependent protoporphyrinogen oxidase
VQPPRKVVVVGGGVSGLATAYFLQRRGGRRVSVSLVEADQRLGGKVLTQQICGHPVDAGPDALLVRVPAMAALLDDLGLAGRVVSPGVLGARIWSRGHLRPLPQSSLFGVPHKLLPLLASGLLSPPGVARAAADLVLPRRRPRPGQDLTIGELIRPRFGGQVFERLVDPLIGGVHAGRADRLSARSVVPEVYDAIRSNRSVYLATRRRPAQPAGAGPSLVTLEGGLVTLVDALVAACGAGSIELGATVRALSRRGDGFEVRLADERVLSADAVVLATPGFAAAELLADVAPVAARACADIPYADVASVTLVYPREGLGRDLDSTGFLVPAVEGLLLVGCSWLSAKWPHLSDPSVVLVRAMVGREGDARFTALSDEELVERVHCELVVTMGMRTVPKEAMVQRWPRAMPQYTVGHQDRLDRIDHDLAALPALVLTGAAYRGVGVASCVSQADRTADALLTRLGTAPALPEGLS